MTITTSCSPAAFLRRMSCVMNNSASRVLPTRVVPSTSECPTRSPSGRLTSTSSRLDAMQARQAADRRQRAHGLKGTSQPVSAGSRDSGNGANSSRSSRRPASR